MSEFKINTQFTEENKNSSEVFDFGNSVSNKKLKPNDGDYIEKENNQGLDDGKRKISNKVNNMPNKSGNENLRYIRYDRGPYVVIVEAKNINPYKLSMDLTKLKIFGVMDIDVINRNKIRIQFKFWDEANKLIDNTILTGMGYKCYIPSMYIYTIGVVRGLPLNITDVDIIENHVCAAKITKVERITRWDTAKEKAIDTETVKITFRTRTLPDKIKIFNINSKLQYFIPNPIFCKKCLNYGHFSRVCVGKQRCNKCAQTINDNKNEIGEDNQTSQHICEAIVCKHCGPGHKTNDFKECEERKQQKIINKCMVMRKVSYVDAKKIIKSENENPIYQKKFNINYWHKTRKDNNEMNEKLDEKLQEIDELKQKLNKQTVFIESLMQLILNGNGETSNDVILFEVGKQCRDYLVEVTNDDSSSHTTDTIK